MDKPLGLFGGVIEVGAAAIGADVGVEDDLLGDAFFGENFRQL